MPLIAKFRVNPRNILSIWEGTEETEAGSTSLGEWHDNDMTRSHGSLIPWLHTCRHSDPRPCFSSANSVEHGVLVLAESKAPADAGHSP